MNHQHLTTTKVQTQLEGKRAGVASLIQVRVIYKVFDELFPHLYHYYLEIVRGYE